MKVKDTGGQFDKVDVISGCYSLMRISGLTTNPTEEDLELALTRLEDVAALFAGRNICTGYNFEDTPDPNSPTNLSRGYKLAYETTLARALLSDFGKQVTQELMDLCRGAMSTASQMSAKERITNTQYASRQPRGSGNTLRYNRWARFFSGQAPAPNSCDTNLMIEGDINNYVEHFDSYLDDGETISSFTITLDPGLTLMSSSNTDTDILYQIKANSNTSTGSMDNQQATIIATTSGGRVETRFVFFNITPLPSQ